MKRGEFYLVRKPGTRDPRKQRVFIIVSRQALVASRFSSVICAPVYSQHDELSTQVNVGPEEGLKRDSSLLTHYVGSLKRSRLWELDGALAIAVGLENVTLPS